MVAMLCFIVYVPLNQNQKQIFCQEEFYTNEEFVLVWKANTFKTTNNEQTVTMIYEI